MAITQAHSRMVSDVDAGSTYLQGTLGTSANNVVQLDGSAKLPAVDGSALTNVSAGKVLQVLRAELNTKPGAGTGTFPHDDTIPQNTEGNELFTLAVTPTNASNKLLINVEVNAAVSATNTAVVALFKDSDADALQAVDAYIVTNKRHTLNLSYYATAGSTSSMTFKVRGGGTNSGEYFYLNGLTSPGSYGNKVVSSITITEIAA